MFKKVRYCLKQVAVLFLEKLFVFSETVHLKEWGVKMQEKQQFYGWLKQLVNKYKSALNGGAKTELNKLC